MSLHNSFELLKGRDGDDVGREDVSGTDGNVVLTKKNNLNKRQRRRRRERLMAILQFQPRWQPTGTDNHDRQRRRTNVRCGIETNFPTPILLQIFSPEIKRRAVRPPLVYSCHRHRSSYSYFLEPRGLCSWMEALLAVTLFAFLLNLASGEVGV